MDISMGVCLKAYLNNCWVYLFLVSGLNILGSDGSNNMRTESHLTDDFLLQLEKCWPFVGIFSPASRHYVVYFFAGVKWSRHPFLFHQIIE